MDGDRVSAGMARKPQSLERDERSSLRTKMVGNRNAENPETQKQRLRFSVFRALWLVVSDHPSNAVIQAYPDLGGFAPRSVDEPERHHQRQVARREIGRAHV